MIDLLQMLVESQQGRIVGEAIGRRSLEQELTQPPIPKSAGRPSTVPEQAPDTSPETKALLKKLTDALELKGRLRPTIRNYTRIVRGYIEFLNRSPGPTDEPKITTTGGPVAATGGGRGNKPTRALRITNRSIYIFFNGRPFIILLTTIPAPLRRAGHKDGTISMPILTEYMPGWLRNAGNCRRRNSVPGRCRSTGSAGAWTCGYIEMLLGKAKSRIHAGRNTREMQKLPNYKHVNTTGIYTRISDEALRQINRARSITMPEFRKTHLLRSNPAGGVMELKEKAGRILFFIGSMAVE